METNYNAQKENSLNLMSFNLPDGTENMIFASKPIDENSYNVFAISNKPQKEQAAAEMQNANAGTKTSAGKQLLGGLFNRIPGLNNKNANNQTEAVNTNQDIKLRCFRLSRQGVKENNQNEIVGVVEYVDPKMIADVARTFGTSQDEPEIQR